MKAMILNRTSLLKDNHKPLDLVEIPEPWPGPREVLIRVSACGVCHTELDEIEGRISPMKLPVVPGHQVVGYIAKAGAEASKYSVGDRVGVAWIFSACGKCTFCREGRENLCEQFLATGKDKNGGYAEFMVAPETYVYPIPGFFNDAEAAPLLCAGAIGYRSLDLSCISDGERLGLTGFGASAHLVLKMVRYRFPKTKTYVFARKEEQRLFARKSGAFWTGDITDRTPEKLHSIIDTTPAWKPVTEALLNLERGGRLVINAIRKENADQEYLRKLSYQDHLWMEKEIKSVANVTARDVTDFLKLAAKASIRPEYQTYPLMEANKALLELRSHDNRGAKVLVISE